MAENNKIDSETTNADKDSKTTNVPRETKTTKTNTAKKTAISKNKPNTIETANKDNTKKDSKTANNDKLERLSTRLSKENNEYLNKYTGLKNISIQEYINSLLDKEREKNQKAIEMFEQAEKLLK